MNELPQAFVERMKALLQDEAAAFLRSYEEPYQRGLRMNTMKTVDAALVPGLLEPVPWEATG